MTLSRRRFLGSAAAFSLGIAGLRRSYAPDGSPGTVVDGLGPLVDDPDGILALPEGFRYRILSQAGERMSDGLFVPTAHDGMATFSGPDGTTILVRNHELNASAEAVDGPFGPANELLDRVDRSLLYDTGTDSGPALGGTTTLVVDTRRGVVLEHHLSLAGTLRNCAGGPTPWGTWITCEETVQRAGRRFARDHGYNFEVPARPGAGLTAAVPLRDMGRFNHEAVAVHPATGIVFQTEDAHDGLLYRFLPRVPGELARGGRLQALAVDEPSFDTRNWGETTVAPGSPLAVRWIEMEGVDSPDDDLRDRGFAAGAARFARGEGMWWGPAERTPGGGHAWFACTNGGRRRKGQIWRYTPSPFEGSDREGEAPGRIELFIEPNDGTLVENADNLTVSPWGDLVVCEDGTGDDFLVGVTPGGEIYRIAHNQNGNGEFAGACFSPDGSTLFVNMQAEGFTVAITGPWDRAHASGGR